jgi:hypothetical protein
MSDTIRKKISINVIQNTKIFGSYLSASKNGDACLNLGACGS